jgi:peptidoglycan hydrolase-like protein with peptidoglycan-binding domain
VDSNTVQKFDPAARLGVHAPNVGVTADNRPMNWTLTGATALMLLAGCSPALNWRSVPLPDAAITITLPCKPDQATRQVELAGAPVELSMTGCDADGATFAVSHAALSDPAQVGAALTHWRAAVLANLGSGAAAAAVDKPYAPVGVLPVPQSVRTTLQGQRADGSPVVAQGVWFARAVGPQVRLYHAVVYSPKSRPEVADQFFAGLALQ